MNLVKGTLHAEIHQRLRNAANWSADGARAIRSRADRVDALDSIKMAEASLLQAKQLISKTFLPVNEPRWPKP